MAVEYSSGRIVTNGLVLSLDAADRNSYPGSGTTWKDISGRGNNGTLNYNPPFNSSNGGSIVFDGGGNVAISNTIPSLSNLTIEFFIYTSIVDNTQNIFFDQFLSLRYEISEGNKFRIHLGNGSGWLFTSDISNTTVVANRWYETAWTWNGNSSIIYVNGIAENNYTRAAGSSGTGIITLGTFNATYNWLGRMGSTKIYNRALSASEILQNYNAQKSRFGL
jgi:hypothetical protein